MEEGVILIGTFLTGNQNICSQGKEELEKQTGDKIVHKFSNFILFVFNCVPQGRCPAVQNWTEVTLSCTKQLPYALCC